VSPLQKLAAVVELTLAKSDFQIYPDVELGVTYDGVVQFARALNAVVRVNHCP
jgi:hypothetical protein